MTAIWFVIHWIDPGPNPLVFSPHVNGWATALLLCVAVDLCWTVAP